MATFSYIQFYGLNTPKGDYAECVDGVFTAYINNDNVMSFEEISPGLESSIKMVNGTTYYMHKSLADLMSEFGKIQYTV